MIFCQNFVNSNILEMDKSNNNKLYIIIFLIICEFLHFFNIYDNNSKRFHI